MLRAVALRTSRRVLALQQQQRHFADAAVASEINWDLVSSLVHTDEGKREMNALRSTYADVKSKIEAMPSTPPKLDWEAMKKEVDPALVDGFKTAFESMKIPEFSGIDSTKVKADFAALYEQAEALEAHANERIKEIKAELEKLDRDMARLESMTVDDAMAADPKLAEEVDREIAENHFMVK